MKVKELIALLEQLEPEKEIFRDNSNYQDTEITTVEFYPNGDYCIV